LQAKRGCAQSGPAPLMETSRNPETGKKLGFGREHRILRRGDFTRTYRGGRKIDGKLVTLFAARRPESAEAPLPWRVGITATRKSGGSVQRNRQRRLVRTYFRLNQHWIPEGWDFVVNTKADLSTQNYWSLAADMDRLMKRLGANPPERGAAPQQSAGTDHRP
jgi:ribonuclease P protein component